MFCPELEGSHWSAGVYARGLLESGFQVVAFDFRSEGESDHQPCYAPLHWPTKLEPEDVRAAIPMIEGRSDLSPAPLGIMGISRGSTPALIAAAEFPQIKAVCCEGAYSTDALLVHFISRWESIYMPQAIVRFLPIWHIGLTSIMVRWTSRLLGNRQYVVLEKWLPKRKNRSVLKVCPSS